MNILSLSRDISKLFGKQIFARIEKQGARRAYGFMLKPIAENDGLTQRELGLLLRLKAPTVSLNLQNMENDGLIIRKADSDDLRSVRIFLTEDGKKLDECISKEINECEEEVLQCLSSEERLIAEAVLKKVLNKLVEDNALESNLP